MTQITVSGDVAGTFQNPVATCNQTHALANLQTTTQVSATGQVDGQPAEIDILDPAGPGDFETESHALFLFQKHPDADWDWIWTTTGEESGNTYTFNPRAGATFSVTLGLDIMGSTTDPPKRITVAGTIVCP